MFEACLQTLKNCEEKLKPGNEIGEVFDIHAKTLDNLGFRKARMKSNKKKIPTVRSKNRQAYFEKRLSKVSPMMRL